MLKGFKEFIFRGNVLDLAVGIVIGAAFGAVVNSFVANLIMAPIGAIFGQPNFDALAAGPFQYGAFLTALVQFLIVAAAIYFVVVVPVNKLKKKEPPKVGPKMRDCPACLQSIPAAASRCMYCTTEVKPKA